MTLPTCRTCHFAVPEDERTGFCHLEPPKQQPINADGQMLSTYTVVGLNKPGCGKHRREAWWRRLIPSAAIL